MLLLLRLHDRNLAHPQRLDVLHPPARAQSADLAKFHVDRSARPADECHVGEHRAVVAVLEVCPYPLLGVASLVKVERVGLFDGAASDV